MKFKNNNKGFTLVELVVSMAVFAISTVAISAILVSAIRYSGLSFRQESNLREVMTVECVLEAALEDAKDIKVFKPQGEAGSQTWGVLSEEIKNENYSNGGIFLMGVKKDSKIYEFLFYKEGVSHPTKLWYRIGDAYLNSVPDSEEDIENLGMTLLSEKIKDLEIIYTAKTLDYQMTVGDQSIDHTMHRYWNIGVKKQAIRAV